MNDFELISLTLDEIRKQAYNLHEARVCFEQNFPSAERAYGMKKEVKRIRLKLRKVFEEIANYNNAIDNVSGVDVALSNVPCDLIYERKKSDDYDDDIED